MRQNTRKIVTRMLALLLFVSAAAVAPLSGCRPSAESGPSGSSSGSDDKAWPGATQDPVEDPEPFNFESHAADLGIELYDPPWHMMDVWWILEDAPDDFETIEIDVTIEGDVSSDFNLYISPINTSFNDRLLYGGIQTNVSGWVSKTDQTRVNIGKGGIFSRWGKDMTEPIGLEYVDMFDDGLCESAGYEGTFCSVRRPYTWSEGTYTFSLLKEETVEFNGEPHTWVALEITDWKTAKTYRVGRLQFEGETLELRDNYAAFVEVYGLEKNAPEITVAFSCPRVDGKELPYTRIVAARSPQSPVIATVASDNGTVVVMVRPKELKPYAEGAEPITLETK